MRIHSKAASLVWKAVIVFFAAYGLLDGSGILAGHYLTSFPYMFTNISNIFALVYFFCAVVWLIVNYRDETKVTFAPMFKYMALMPLLVTMLIAHFLLFDTLFQNGSIVWHLVWLHYVVPIMSLLDWLLFDEKGKMRAWNPFVWMAVPIAYLAFMFIYVGVFGGYMGGGTTADITRYPYTFFDPEINGVGGVVAICVAMIGAFLVLGFVIFGIDKLLGRVSAKRTADKNVG